MEKQTNASTLKAVISPECDSIPTRATLINRLKDWGDDRSWNDFYDTYHRLILSVAVRSGLTSTEAQEALQETLVSVAKKMGKFQLDPSGSFKAWLMVITRRRIVDQFRKRSKLPQANRGRRENADGTSTIERIPDPAGLKLEAMWEEEWKHNLSEVALEKAKQKTSAKEFFLFHQQVVKEWSPKQAAKQLGVSVTFAYVAKYRVSKLVKKEARILEKQMLDAEGKP